MQLNRYQQGNAMGKSMWLMAIVCALGLLVLVFDDLLDKQYNPNESPDSVLNGSSV